MLIKEINVPLNQTNLKLLMEAEDLMQLLREAEGMSTDLVYDNEAVKGLILELSTIYQRIKNEH